MFLIGIMISIFHNNCFSQINYQSGSTISYPEDTMTDKRFRKLTHAEANFLLSYYEQDGNHSPVTGGTGTERLADRVAKLTVNVPFGKGHKLTLINGIDSYTSASTDNINNIVSSASYQDERHYHSIGYSKVTKPEIITYGANIGLSDEWDVRSFSGGVFLAFTTKDKNTEININGLIYHDIWKIIYPAELRIIARQQGEFLNTNIRNSNDLGITISRVISKKLQGSISAEIIHQNGLLSTPFHRVYFTNSDTAKVEFLPSSRIKYPLGIRLNYYINEHFVFRGHYRYYKDDFDITAHSLSIELPVKFVKNFTFTPFFRYHNQTEAKYFKPYKEHTPGTTFYTSDYDLSGFSSRKIGLGVRYSPVYGLGRMKTPFYKDRLLVFKKIDLRYARYYRSDGLHAWIMSVDFTFNL